MKPLKILSHLLQLSIVIVLTLLLVNIMMDVLFYQLPTLLEGAIIVGSVIIFVTLLLYVGIIKLKCLLKHMGVIPINKIVPKVPSPFLEEEF